IRLDVAARRIDLLVGDDELAARMAAWQAAPRERALAVRGYAKLFETSVLQADQGCDFDFLLNATPGVNQ
ncbi:MAG: hypothetical protein B7X01_03930, partial [Acidiphilium sp. 21-62-4]